MTQKNAWSSVEKIRATYVDYFVQVQNHKHVVSSPVVPHNDPTLLFVNAGMNQFKPILQGNVESSHPFFGLKRAANSQKCIRAGGKHNDLEDVGKDTYHHTFFEMLGNWSFGDYFKREAIGYAWDLLTNVYGLDASRLYVTYFGGDPREPSVPVDEEARQIWLQYLPAERVLPFGLKENFWEMGDTGPCGPCSEIHFDRIGGRDAAQWVNMDDPDVLEIWNLVFMQFNRERDRSLTLLPATGVDTGMGLERLASVLQNFRSNYDIDIFQKIFVAIQTLCPEIKPYGGELKDPVDIAYRVVADHIRTLTVALADGAVPSNQDRGYVLRRILRRAIRYGNDFLHAPTGFFAKLADAVDETLGNSFPEIRRNLADVKAVLLDEELQFRRTLEKGTREFKARVAKLADGVTVLSGSDAFVLFTTFGFPLDLTQLMAAELGLAVDVDEFNAEFEKFRQQSREASMFGGGGQDGANVVTFGPHETHHLEQTLKLPQTDDKFKFLWSSAEGVGADLTCTLKAVFDGKQWLQQLDAQTLAGKTVALVFDKTPFYAEAGGQIYDVGTVASGKDARPFAFEVKNTQKYGGYVIHIGQVSEGAASLQDELVLTVDFARRSLVAKNHTATHILNLALRETLGDKVEQKGSLVDPARLRFDFAAAKPMELDEVRQVDQLVNQQIAMKLPVFAEEVELTKAQTIPGIRAVFGETYPNPVRVLSVGRNVQTLLSGDAAPAPESVEFCGGTHVANAAEITRFVVLNEEGVAKGVRRIVAVTGPEAIRTERRAADLLLRVNEVVAGNGSNDTVDSLRIAIAEDKDLPYVARRSMLLQLEVLLAEQLKKDKEKFKELQKTAVKSAEAVAEALATDSTEDFLVIDFPELLGDNKALALALDTLTNKLPTKAFLVVSAGTAKTVYIATVPKTLATKRSAKAWLDHASLVANGKGGGSDAKAQGVCDGSVAEAILKSAKSFSL